MARTAFEWAPHKCANAVNIDTYGYMCVTWALRAIACRRNRHTHTPRTHVRAPASSTSNFLVFAVVTSACSVTELHANARAYAHSRYYYFANNNETSNTHDHRVS